MNFFNVVIKDSFVLFYLFAYVSKIDCFYSSMGVGMDGGKYVYECYVFIIIFLF